MFKLDLSKNHKVTYYGKGYTYHEDTNVPKILNRVEKPDFIFTYVMAYASLFDGFELTKIPKVHYEVDYFPYPGGTGSVEVQNKFYFKRKYNLIFAPTISMVNLMKENKISEKIFWLPFSVCVEKYKNLGLDKTIDVMATFTMKSHFYPGRQKVHDVINSLKIKTFTENVIHEDYIKKINESKIFVTNNGIYKSLNMKYTEVMSCGTFLLADKPEDLDDIGFKDGEHLVIYKNWKDLKNKIQYYLKNDKEREEIAKNGMNLVREKHNNSVRIQEMTDIIKKELF